MKTERLPVRLTDDELRQRGAELARLYNEIERKMADAKDQAAAAKKDVEDAKVKASLVAKQLREQSEERLVGVTEVNDTVRRVVERIRLDTGEVFYTRPMRLDELQVPIPFEPRVHEGGEASASA